MKLLLYFFYLMGFALASCSTAKNAVTGSEQTTAATAQSITTTETKADSPVNTKPEAIHDTITVQIDCDKNGVGTIRPVVSQKQGRKVSTTVAGAGNKLIIAGKKEAETLFIPTKTKSETITTASQQTATIQKEKACPPCKVSIYSRIAFFLLGAATLILLRGGILWILDRFLVFPISK